MISVKIPRKALAITRYDAPMPAEGESEGDRKILPEANDPIEFRAEGVVTSVDGETCTVELRFINGQRPEMADEKKSDEKPADEGDALRKTAEAKDANTDEEE